MLGYLLILGALILGLAAGYDLPQIAAYFLQGLLEKGTLQLLRVITLIEMLTIFLELTGSLQRILAFLRRIFENSGVLIALVPSLLGFFPVPGGAMLPAPMVGIYGDEIGFKANRKATINLFFRHIWDLVFPFKPHLILAATVVNIPLFNLIGWHLPVTLASVLVGFWFLIGRDPRLKSLLPTNHEDPPRGRPLWIEVAPLVIPLVLALGLRIDFVYAMAAGLLFGLLTQKVSGSMLKKWFSKESAPSSFLFWLLS
ncbi:MAG: DUF401 family protein [Proteobacteria bacterium]|nr:DUF401 family protein [Pseudomonadota bacterium]